MNWTFVEFEMEESSLNSFRMWIDLSQTTNVPIS